MSGFNTVYASGDILNHLRKDTSFSKVVLEELPGHFWGKEAVALSTWTVTLDCIGSNLYSSTS